jgi:hypothetical protein
MMTDTELLAYFLLALVCLSLWSRSARNRYKVSASEDRAQFRMRLILTSPLPFALLWSIQPHDSCPALAAARSTGKLGLMILFPTLLVTAVGCLCKRLKSRDACQQGFRRMRPAPYILSAFLRLRLP